MAKQTILKPWHEVLELREDLKSGDLSLAIFAADLYDVVMQKGQRPVYEDPREFFAFSYPTLNLRELVKDVCQRLAGKTDRAYRKLSVNYGGGKTHSLITLWHLVHDPDRLPALPAIQEFEAHSGLKPPKARVAALCFDKIDLERGIETKAPRRSNEDAETSMERSGVPTGRLRRTEDHPWRRARCRARNTARRAVDDGTPEGASTRRLGHVGAS